MSKTSTNSKIAELILRQSVEEKMAFSIALAAIVEDDAMADSLYRGLDVWANYFNIITKQKPILLKLRITNS